MGRPIAARDWIFEQSDEADTPTWNEIAGITEFTLNRGENNETADTTEFSSQGDHESQAMQRGATLELTGHKHLDDTGAPDAGQELVEQKGGQVGQASLGQFRFRHQSQTEWTVWTAHASLGEQGGGNNAMTSWSVTLTKSGPATTEATS